MAPAAVAIFARQHENCTFTADGYIDEKSCFVPFWSTRTGVIIKWSLFLGLIVILALYLLLGHIHAQRRIRKGLPPLGYHRFLVSRGTLAQVDPRYRFPQAASIRPYNPDNQYYNMYAMPPPVYDPNAPPPPKYEPPAGSTKVGSGQQGAEQSNHPQQSEGRADYAPPPGPPPAATQPRDTYAPPPGPPPGAVRPQGTGNTNPFRD